MLKDKLKLILPNPHGKDIGKNLLLKILRQANIDKSECEKL
jgi:predicted RNA binding protein YcfA (HicA-like mRNA interferase family)